jgi:hypothetical protein
LCAERSVVAQVPPVLAAPATASPAVLPTLCLLPCACFAGLLAVVQAAHADLKSTQGCVLVTGAGISLETDRSAQVAVGWDSIALAVAKAAQRKLVHILPKA